MLRAPIGQNRANVRGRQAQQRVVSTPPGVGHQRGRGVRQVPGHSRGLLRTRFYRPNPSVVYQPRHHFSTIHINGGRIGSVSFIIMGIVLALFGALILPGDPIAGILIGGMGIGMVAMGGAAYNAYYRE